MFELFDPEPRARDAPANLSTPRREGVLVTRKNEGIAARSRERNGRAGFPCARCFFTAESIPTLAVLFSCRGVSHAVQLPGPDLHQTIGEEQGGGSVVPGPPSALRPSAVAGGARRHDN